MSDAPDSPGGSENAPAPSNAPSNAPSMSNAPESGKGAEPGQAPAPTTEPQQTPLQAVDQMPHARWEAENAPALTQEFNQAAQTERVDDGLGQGPVSVLQRDQLIKERAEPVRELNYPIHGPVQQEVDTHIERKREAMIKHINERLQRVQGRARDSFNRER